MNHHSDDEGTPVFREIQLPKVHESKHQWLNIMFLWNNLITRIFHCKYILHYTLHFKLWKNMGALMMDRSSKIKQNTCYLDRGPQPVARILYQKLLCLYFQHSKSKLIRFFYTLAVHQFFYRVCQRFTLIIIFNYFWPLLKLTSFFEAAGTVLKKPKTEKLLPRLTKLSLSKSVTHSLSLVVSLVVRKKVKNHCT